MDVSQRILSDITVFNKYAKYEQSLKRREQWIDTCIRNQEMHIAKYPMLKDEIINVYRDFVIPKSVLPSMRSLQFGGKPIMLNNSRIFNCSFIGIDDWHVFSEAMFLLLSGCGFGYSVQKHHINRLPEIKQPIKIRKYLIGDSIEGWADAVKILCRAYFLGDYMPRFDFSDIRPKGAPLVTSGGRAPGPEPLKDCLHNINKIFQRKKIGDKLTSLECHDMLCYIADAVLAGGIRRSAMISLFNIDDEEMLTSKFGEWYIDNPQRARANNSAVVLRHKFKEKDFLNLWKKIEMSGSGEPGIFLTNDKNIGTNPCGEVALKASGQMCNLTEINTSDLKSEEDFFARAKAAAFLGTLQAGYTDFHYLRDCWKETTEKEALLGVSLTGIASGTVLTYNMSNGADIVLLENERIAKIIGINKAARTTLVKPAGTTSMVLGCSSGIHAWHAEYYLRRMRIGKDELLYKYLKRVLPEFIEDDFFKPTTLAIISIPQKAPDNAILRTESPIDLLERVKKVKTNWVDEGHRKGSNTHNVSVTVSIKEGEWESVGNWMWDNKEFYNGISVLPYDNGTYVQAPFEEITKDVYEKMFAKLKNIDLTKVMELEDSTSLQGELACSGGSCEII